MTSLRLDLGQAVKRIILSKSIEIPSSATWHKDRLILASSIGAISETLSDDLHEFLSFRHYFVHAYGFMLEEAYLEDLVTNIPNVWEQFLLETDNFINRDCRKSDENETFRIM